MRVFISHSSHDKPKVRVLANALTDRGFQVWLDEWEIKAGDDIVASINRGLDEAHAGIIVFSRHSELSRWVEQEANALTFARIEEKKLVIPLRADDYAFIPPLLRSLACRQIEDVEAVVDALRNRGGRPLPGRSPEQGSERRVHIQFVEDTGGVSVTVSVDGKVHGTQRHNALPAAVVSQSAEFRQGRWLGTQRHEFMASQARAESNLSELGRALGSLCFPQGSAAAVAELLQQCPLGTLTEVCVEANSVAVLDLPFEALRLPDGQVLSTHPKVVMSRRIAGLPSSVQQRLAGPLKILVAVASPDEDKSPAVVLDQERELQNILDAVEDMSASGNAQVRILEVGSPQQIAEALGADAYHVLHLSCHGAPGRLELEDEDGAPIAVTPRELLEPISETGRPLPLVLLNACHGGVAAGATAGFAEALLRQGVPAVVAMQAAVTDFYATELAREFYAGLTEGEHLLPSRALARARRQLEQTRSKRLQSGAPPEQTQPEYATATLFLAGPEGPLANFGLDKKTLSLPPTYTVNGPVPQLQIGYLIGRRKELRTVLKPLRDSAGSYAGVVLTGMGGIGKSSLAGRAMQRMRESGWRIAACAGRFNLYQIAMALSGALKDSDGYQKDDTPADRARKSMAERLTQQGCDDQERLGWIKKALSEERVLLVLDDFELNLTQGGAAFHDPDAAAGLKELAQAARRGRLLITCRYLIPGMAVLLERVAVGRLSDVQSRKLLLRLKGLHQSQSPALARALQEASGHPRLLELLNALFANDATQLRHVREKLAQLLEKQAVDLEGARGSVEQSLEEARTLSLRDICLEELLHVAREKQLEEVLFQVAASNLEVTEAGLARMLARQSAELDFTEPGDLRAARDALIALENLSLVQRSEEGSGWVHRWTAEGLSRLDPPLYRKSSERAGKYRVWRVGEESHLLEDAQEAVRNFLAVGAFDDAIRMVVLCFQAMTRFRYSIGIAAFASEILEVLPEAHGSFTWVADQEAQAHLALGQTSRAFARYGALLKRNENRSEQEPHRTDYQWDLSALCNKMGDLYRALGQGGEAAKAHHRALNIAERLAQLEPQRAEFQRSLSVAYYKMGDLYGELGQGNAAREMYQKALDITERLAQSEPQRNDYQRDLAISYNKMGDLYRELGQAEAARAAYQRDLEITERLTRSEPQRAEYQRDLWVSYNKMGDLYVALGQNEVAREAYQRAMQIVEALTQSEPQRTDYQRDLSISYTHIGNIYRELEQRAAALEAYQSAMHIAQRLAQSEPQRTDYQRDLSIAYNKLGNLYYELGQGEAALEAYQKDLEIAARLAQSEPERADYQRDLSVSYNRMGDLYYELGQADAARAAYQKDLEIAERLAQLEPQRADYQRDLIVSLMRVGSFNDSSSSMYLQRAWDLIGKMRAVGTLDPADEAIVPALKLLLGEAGIAVGE